MKSSFTLLDLDFLVTQFREQKSLGYPVFYFYQLASTNEYGRRLLTRGGEANGTLIIAEYQSKGRGRHGRQWLAPPGQALLFSLLICQHAVPQRALPLLTMMGALSVAETLRENYSLRPTIKWPNDVLLKGRKIAGILVELSNSLYGPSDAVLGIGVNANQRLEHFDFETVPPPISVCMAVGKEIDRSLLLGALLRRLNQYYEVLRQGRVSELLEGWKLYSSTIGKRIRVRTHQGELQGVALGLEEDGALCVRDDQGFMHRLLSGEVEEVTSLPKE